MECYVTDSVRRFEKVHLKSTWSLRAPEMQLVKVYPDISYQSVIGFGAALTESSAYVFAQMDPSDQKRLIDLYFGDEGNRYSLCRTVIQSSDFSLAPRTYMENSHDEDLTSFSIDGDRLYELPLIRAALECNPKLELLASPWSPPSWAKTNRSMSFGGHLRKSKYALWAKMIARYLFAYREEGVKIGRITVQNEVEARQTWESCLFNAHQETEFAQSFLRPALDEAGLHDVKILIWDHNKEGMLDRVRACQHQGGEDVIDGVAFHWYSGDHFEALAATRDFIGMEKELIFSEGCDSFSAGDPSRELPHAEHYAHEIIGDLNAGANGVLDWNLLLDAQGGPNHMGNFCDSPVMYNSEQHQLNVRLPYYYLGHFSRFLQPGSKRILITKYTDKLEVTAFLDIASKLVIVILNRSDNDIYARIYTQRREGIPYQTYELCSSKHSIMTMKE